VRIVTGAYFMSVPQFRFPDEFGDARVEELRLLSWTDQHDELVFAWMPKRRPWHDLVVSLVSNNLLSTFSFEWAKGAASDVHNPNPDLGASSGLPYGSPLERAINSVKARTVYDLYEMRAPSGLRLTHEGRVRLSELKQALRTGREREPFGILWDARHWEQDLQIAVLDAREGASLAVAYLDMNGLKQLNDTRGHDAGDRALKTYFQAVASVLGERGQAYRVGGDEVLVVLSNSDAQRSAHLLGLACKKLMSERLEEVGAPQFLSIAAGIICATDSSALPAALRAAADKVQYRAKEESKKASPRPSVIAIEGQEDMIVVEFA
jgi:diguanylate cyclase (GGDEF)-like protein